MKIERIQMKEYFYKIEYIFLYLSKFFYTFANSFIEIFGVVMLYKNGMPIYMILLIYGIRFGIMGICSPMFLKISSKLGIASCALLSSILRVISSYMILTGKYNNMLILILAMSLSGALSNQIEDAVSSRYVEEKHRGRYNSLRNIAIILGQVLATTVGAWGIVTENNTLLILAISISFLLHYLCVAMVDYKPKVENRKVLKNSIRYMVKNRNKYTIIYSLKTSHIAERLFVPLYIYIALQDFVAFAIVITVSLIIQIVTVIITGGLTDKNIEKSNWIVSIVRVVITSIYLLIRNKFIISFNKTLSDNFEKIYETSIRSSIQNMMKEYNEEKSFLSTVGQMSLCFTELIVFPILAIISIWLQEKVFYIIFALSIFSTIEINRRINKTTSTVIKCRKMTKKSS